MPAFFLMALEEDRLGVETRGIKYISNRLKVLNFQADDAGERPIEGHRSGLLQS